MSGGARHVASLLLLTNALEPSADVLPALALLGHNLRVAPLEPTALLDVPSGDVILIDARRDLAHARSMTRLLHTEQDADDQRHTACLGDDQLLLQVPPGPRHGRRPVVRLTEIAPAGIPAESVPMP